MEYVFQGFLLCMLGNFFDRLSRMSAGQFDGRITPDMAEQWTDEAVSRAVGGISSDVEIARAHLSDRDRKELDAAIASRDFSKILQLTQKGKNNLAEGQ